MTDVTSGCGRERHRGGLAAAQSEADSSHIQPHQEKSPGPLPDGGLLHFDSRSGTTLR